MRLKTSNAWLRRWWIWGIVATFVTAVSSLLAYNWWRDQQISQELARLRAAGVPTSADELDAFYEVPDGVPDATGAWMRPIRAIEGGVIGRHPYGFEVLDNYGHWPPAPGEEWSELERARQYVADHQSLFDMIDAAAGTPGQCCFIRDFSGGAEIILPHAQWARNIMLLLTLRAYVHAHENDAAAVVGDIDAMIKTSDALAREPIRVTQHVRGFTLDLAVLTLERLLPMLAESDVDLAGLQSALTRVDLHDGLERAVIGDRVMGLTVFADPSTAGAGPAPAFFYKAWVSDDPCEFLTAMREIENTAGSDWPELLATGEVDDEDGWTHTGVRPPWGGEDWYAPTKTAQTVMTRTIHALGRDVARCRAAMAGLAVARYEQEFHPRPKSLEELVPRFLDEVPQDPFTGQPLKFATDSESIRIYSVGPNRRDDGGRETPVVEGDGDRHYRGDPDIVFEVRQDSR